MMTFGANRKFRPEPGSNLKTSSVRSHGPARPALKGTRAITPIMPTMPLMNTIAPTPPSHRPATHRPPSSHRAPSPPSLALTFAAALAAGPAIDAALPAAEANSPGTWRAGWIVGETLGPEQSPIRFTNDTTLSNVTFL